MSEYDLYKKRRKIKQLVTGSLFLAVLMGGWRYPLLGYFIPLCMLLGIGISFFKGRKWCDWFCPRGSFSDSIIKYISPGGKIPPFFKGMKSRVSFLSFLMLIMAIQIIRYWPDPYKIGIFFMALLTITTIIGIILALVFHQRTWCCFCPIGSIANCIGSKKYPLRIDSGICTECRLCHKVCPIQVAPLKYRGPGPETVKDGDCLKCGLCVLSCPEKALTL